MGKIIADVFQSLFKADVGEDVGAIADLQYAESAVNNRCQRVKNAFRSVRLSVVIVIWIAFRVGKAGQNECDKNDSFNGCYCAHPFLNFAGFGRAIIFGEYLSQYDNASTECLNENSL